MLIGARIDDVRAGRIDAVVIGTSAGGIEALGTLLPPLPAACHFPCVIVLHMPPRERSPVVEVFAHRCAVAVREAADKDPVEGGVAWFAPPDYHLMIETDRTFALSTEAPVNFSRPSIDVLFESAARAYGRALLAIVLTGASADGAEGAAAVCAAGGVLVVQDPASAEMPLMPSAAQNLARPHAVGSLGEIATLLRTSALSRHR
jgi:two-component system, chemotaxis family, protein-glutamate methylesterase/glutaminase